MRGRIKQVVEHLVGAALVVVAATPWLQVTSPFDARIVVLGAASVAIIVGLIAARTFAVRLRVEVAVSTAALLAFLLLVVVRDPTAIAEVARGLRDGIPRLLSTTLPILDVRWAAVPAAVVAWTAGAVATSAITRSRSVAVPVGAAFVAFLGGYVVTLGGASGDPATHGLGAAPVVALLAFLLAAIRADRITLPGHWRRGVARAAAAAGIVVVSVAVAMVVTDHAPFASEEPVQPRLTPEASVREPMSPTLATRRMRGDDIDRIVGHVTVADEWSGYVALAALQDYNGRIWSIGREHFDPTGGTLPVELPVGGGGAVTFEEIDTAATGGWLPYVARAATIEGISVLHNGGGAFQLAEPVTRATYRLRSSQPSLTLADDAVADDARVASGSTTPISVPTSMSDRRPAGERVCRFLSLSRDSTAEPNIDGIECGRQAPRDVGFLRALSATLREGRAVQDDIVGGDQLESGSEALYDLLDLVGAPRGEAAVGTPEQFASAFALMADDFGIPVRVVTGFRVEEPASGSPEPLLGGQAWTWVEVPIEGYGWVVVDPSPSAQDELEQDDLDELTGMDEEQEVVEEERTLVGVDPSQTIGSPPPVETDDLPWMWLLVLVPLVPVLVVLIAAVRRLLRRRRRRRGNAQHQIVGAWHEALDGVYDAGIRDLEALSGGEVADAVVGSVPWLAAPLEELAGMANRAIFSSRPIVPAEVDRAWEIARTVRRDLRRSAGWRVRLRARISPPPIELTAPFVKRA